MKLPLQIVWRDIDQSDAVEAAIREKVDKMEQYYENIMACRVAVEAPHKHQNKGRLYRIRLDITVPGNEFVVKRSPDQHAAHEDIYVAIRDAFDEACRQLKEYARKQQGKVKRHDVPHHARVIKRFPAQDYGILETPDGRQVYFHRNAVVGADFDMMNVGTEVNFVEEQGNEGPQARTVTLVKTPGTP